jgi:two-component system NtrC family sensor kinase
MQAAEAVRNDSPAGSADPQPVFDSIVRSAHALCGARFCAAFGFDGALLHLVAEQGLPPRDAAAFAAAFPAPAARDTAVGRAALNHCIESVPDSLADPGYAGASPERALGSRAIVAVPVLVRGRPIFC